MSSPNVVLAVAQLRPYPDTELISAAKAGVSVHSYRSAEALRHPKNSTGEDARASSVQVAAHCASQKL